nr:copia protein [Tanacetum cinerariifolium]
TSSVPASNVPTSIVPASNVPASSVPAGGVLAGSVDSAGFGDPATSESVPAIFNPDLADNSTLPPSHSLGSRTKWILKNKRDARGIVVRNKARLVAQVHRQEEGIDHDEVFALVARIEAIRLFLAFAS